MLGNTSVAFDAGAASGETAVVLPVALSAGAWGVCWSPDDGATFYALPEVLRVVPPAHEGSIERFTPYSVTKTLEAPFVFYGAACSAQSFLGETRLYFSNRSIPKPRNPKPCTLTQKP